jgi:outer membrane protein assembly factor BamB
MQIGSGNVQYNYFGDAGSGDHADTPSASVSRPAGPNHSGHAFICYVREDAVAVDRLQRTLEAAGIVVWRDTVDLWPGEDWRARIRNAIAEDALAFIACFSSRSVARPRSYQNEELLLAIDQLRQRPPGRSWLFPVRFDNCALPDFDLGAGRTLASYQRADLFGANRDLETGRLVTAVQKLLDFDPSVAPHAGHAHAGVTRESTGYAPAIAGGNGSVDGGKRRPGHKRSPGRGRGRATIWVAAGIAITLAAGVAALLFLVLSPNPGTPSLPAEDVIVHRVLRAGTYGFSDPQYIASDGSYVWVTNGLDNSVTELNATNGTWIRTLKGGNYQFNSPNGIASDGTHIWVTNFNGNSVTELNASDGTWIRTLKGGNYGFSVPNGIVADGTRVWVANQGGSATGNPGASVTELNAGDGTWVRTLKGGNYGLNWPQGIAVDGTHLWVTNLFGNSVTELNASDGTWVRTLAGSNYGFNSPDGIIVDGTHIWVTNEGDSVMELNASDGSVIRTLTGDNYGFSNPQGITSDGTHIWVTNFNGNTVTELNASDGTWIRTLTGDSYGFGGPKGVIADDTHIWVANAGRGYNSVTELTAG